MTPKFGRLVASDPRDAGYSIRTLLSVEPSSRHYRYWGARGWFGDQGSTPQCVGYAWTHWLEDGPVTQRGTAPVVSPTHVYDLAQEADEFPGTDYEGTTVRAGAKVLRDLGFITEFRWATDLDDVVQALLELGPVVVGTYWYAEMMTPDPEGFILMAGDVLGGHAYVLNGVNTDRRVLRLKNSWGKDWGRGGSAWLSFEDFKSLLVNGGEACVAVEIKKD